MRTAVVGAADHAGWAVLVTVARDQRVLDRRRVELVDGALPKLPHHHEAQGLPLKQGLALIERVRRSANTHASAALDAIAPLGVGGLALRRCPELPPTVAERLADYRAQCVADTVMYREALAAAAAARGWFVQWYEPKVVLASVAQSLLEKTGKALGRPWQQDHRVAMAAAIAAAATGHS